MYSLGLHAPYLRDTLQTQGPPLTRTPTGSLLSLGALGEEELNLKDLPKRGINALAWERCGRDVALHRG